MTLFSQSNQIISRRVAPMRARITRRQRMVRIPCGVAPTRARITRTAVPPACGASCRAHASADNSMAILGGRALRSRAHTGADNSVATTASLIEDTSRPYGRG